MAGEQEFAVCDWVQEGKLVFEIQQLSTHAGFTIPKSLVTCVFEEKPDEMQSFGPWSTGETDADFQWRPTEDELEAMPDLREIADSSIPAITVGISLATLAPRVVEVVKREFASGKVNLQVYCPESHDTETLHRVLGAIVGAGVEAGNQVDDTPQVFGQYL